MPSRPASDFEPLVLLEAVEDIAKLARPDDPGRVAQRPWDRARPLSARFADAPAARRIAEDLGLPWAEVVRIALLPPGRREQALGVQLGDDEQDWLTPEHIAFSLRLIAGRLSVRTLTPMQYRGELARLLGENAGRSNHGSHLRLPTDHQVASAAGGWDAALRLAGLAVRRQRGGQAARVQPVAIVDVLERCFAHHGTEPTGRELECFARANGIPFPRRERGRPWSAYVRDWKRLRRARGLPVPVGPPPKPQRPDYGQDVGAALPGERRSRKAWDDPDELAGWVVRYLVELPRSDRAGQRGYDLWASGHDGAPWTSTFAEHGGWSGMLTRARSL